MPYKDIEKRRESGRKNSKKYYHKDRVKSLEIQRKWRESLKKKVISYYSGGKMCCACCGESIPEFLTVDHINNDGTQERKMSASGGHHNYRKIIKKHFPNGYQILCYNCNCGRARTKDKVCPHKNDPQKKEQISNTQSTRPDMATL